MFEWIFIHWIMSNAYTLLIIYARIDLTPWYIEFLYCLLVVEEVIYQFKLKLKSSTGIYFNRQRYEVWSFSVRHLISIAYWKGLISGVKLSVLVPQSKGISLCNTCWKGSALTSNHVGTNPTIATEWLCTYIWSCRNQSYNHLRMALHLHLIM